jgi:tetratricopeptide (TPR) repeat protein
MVRPLLFKWLLLVAAALVMLVALPITLAFCQEAGEGDAGHHNRQGLVYFKKGFYDHAPKKQSAEAERNYGLAVKEFRAAIAREPSLTDAHRNLARVFYVQKNFSGAAEEYRRVTQLAPGDLDSYVNLALALIDLKRPDEAIKALEAAKGRTSDPRELDKLDNYISKVRAHQKNEAR